MTILARRLVTLAGATVKDPLASDDTQLALVQGRIGIRVEPTVVLQGPAPLPSIPDFFDLLTDESFDKSAFVTLYEATLDASGAITVERDLFGPNDFPHTWSGWPLPGDPERQPKGAFPTGAEKRILDSIRYRVTQPKT
jgi:hypothetical protein